MLTSQKIGVAAIASLAVLAAVVLMIRVIDREPGKMQSATVLPQPMPLPDFQLSDQSGEPLDRTSFLHHSTLLFFGFTQCPDICPATLQQLAVARRRLAETLPAGTSPPQILLISVDPERDSPRVLKEYTGHFGSGVSGASGDIEQLRKLTTPLGIYFAKDFSAGQDYTMSHSAAVLFINDKAEFKAVFNAPLNIDKLVADLSMLVTGH